MVALVQRPAPAFKAEVVKEGGFEQVSLSDFLGQWYVRLDVVRLRVLPSLSRVVLLFYPMYVSLRTFILHARLKGFPQGLHICLPNVSVSLA
jgi:hypothetical protein